MVVGRRRLAGENRKECFWNPIGLGWPNDGAIWPTWPSGWTIDLICSFDSAGDTTMDTLSMLIFGWMLFGLVVLCVGKYVYNRFVLNEVVSSTTILAAKDGHIVHSDSVSVGGGGGGGGVGGGGVGGSKSALLVKQKVPASASAPSAAGKSSSASGGTGGGGSAGSGGGSGASTTSGIGSSPSAYVPPTPPVRKRLTARKTSGALISPARSSRSLHLPTATGADPDAVRWVNEIDHRLAVLRPSDTGRTADSLGLLAQRLYRQFC